MVRFAMATLAVLAIAMPATSFAGGCYLCGSGSSNGCQQCAYSSDTGEARKACEAKGCKISGTASCSTAANVKVCSTVYQDPSQVPVFVF